MMYGMIGALFLLGFSTIFQAMESHIPFQLSEYLKKLPVAFERNNKEWTVGRAAARRICDGFGKVTLYQTIKSRVPGQKDITIEQPLNSEVAYAAHLATLINDRKTEIVTIAQKITQAKKIPEDKRTNWNQHDEKWKDWEVKQEVLVRSNLIAVSEFFKRQFVVPLLVKKDPKFFLYQMVSQQLLPEKDYTNESCRFHRDKNCVIPFKGLDAIRKTEQELLLEYAQCFKKYHDWEWYNRWHKRTSNYLTEEDYEEKEEAVLPAAAFFWKSDSQAKIIEQYQKLYKQISGSIDSFYSNEVKINLQALTQNWHTQTVSVLEGLRSYYEVGDPLKVKSVDFNSPYDLNQTNLNNLQELIDWMRADNRVAVEYGNKVNKYFSDKQTAAKDSADLYRQGSKCAYWLKLLTWIGGGLLLLKARCWNLVQLKKHKKAFAGGAGLLLFGYGCKKGYERWKKASDAYTKEAADLTIKLEEIQHYCKQNTDMSNRWQKILAKV